MLTQEITTHTYPNGLTLIVEPMQEVQSAAFSILVPAGCIHDPTNAEGCAALLSDWIMRGAGSLDNQQLANALDNLGLQRNEGVGSSHISFTGATIAESVPAALRLYADVILRPHLPDDEFAPAKMGIEQTLQALEDEPRQKILIELRRRTYESPWGHPSEGSLEGIRALTPEIVKANYKRCFQPTDAIIGVAGNVNVRQIIDLVGDLFAEWKPGAAPHVTPGPRGAQRDHLHHESTQTQIGIAYDSVPYRDEEYYAAWAAVGILSGGMSARLFTEVREKRGLCYSVFASLASLRDQGRVLCYAGTTVERAQETLDVTIGELIRLGDGIGEDELIRCKARAKSSLIMQQESSASRSSSLARDWYYLGRVTTLDEVRGKIEALTVPALLDHIHSHPAKNFTILTLGPSPLEVPSGVL